MPLGSLGMLVPKAFVDWDRGGEGGIARLPMRAGGGLERAARRPGGWAKINAMRSRRLPLTILLTAVLSSTIFAQAGRRAGAAPKTADKCHIPSPITGDIAAEV